MPRLYGRRRAELLADVYASSCGLDIVGARPFSHWGPGQLPIFLLSSLARQAAEGLAELLAPIKVEHVVDATAWWESELASGR